MFTESLQLKLQGWDPETRGNFKGTRTKGRFVACLKLEVFFTEKAGISGKLRKAESGEEAAGKRRPILWRVKSMKSGISIVAVTVESMEYLGQYLKM